MFPDYFNNNNNNKQLVSSNKPPSARLQPPCSARLDTGHRRVELLQTSRPRCQLQTAVDQPTFHRWAHRGPTSPQQRHTVSPSGSTQSTTNISETSYQTHSIKEKTQISRSFSFATRTQYSEAHFTLLSDGWMDGWSYVLRPRQHSIGLLSVKLSYLLSYHFWNVSPHPFHRYTL